MTKKSKRSKSLFEESELHDSGIHDASTPLRSDPHFVAAAASRPTERHAAAHGRRILHVAWMQAKDAEHEARVLEEAIPDYERVGDLAAAAAIPLKRLIRNLVGDYRSNEVHRVAALVPPLRRMAAHMGPKSRSDQRQALAERQAHALFEAAIVVSRLARYAAKRRGTLAGGRQNAGRVDKAAFLRALAEGWLFLTGRLPGLGVERNPFLRLAEACWEDCGGSQNESFASQLRPVVKAMRESSVYQAPYVPDWI